MKSSNEPESNVRQELSERARELDKMRRVESRRAWKRVIFSTKDGSISKSRQVESENLLHRRPA